jgi:hypothetical protein
MKINILSKAEPAKVVQTIHKVVEHAPSFAQHLPHIDPSAFHLVDPLTVAATAGVVVTVAAGFIGKLASGLSGILH